MATIPRRAEPETAPAAATGAGGATAGHTEPDRRLVVTYGRASGISGLLFALLFVVALALLHRGPRLADSDSAYTGFYAQDGGRNLIIVGLYLVPFAGIAFLWHLAATRAFFGGYPETLPAIPRFLQQAAGVAFVCLVFAGTAAFGVVALLGALRVSSLPSADVARSLAGLGYGLMFVYAVRFAGMYMITTIAMARRLGFMPRWLAALGYLGAAFLLVNTTFHPAVLLVFPGWVLVASFLALNRASSMRTGPRPGALRPK